MQLAFFYGSATVSVMLISMILFLVSVKKFFKYLIG